MGLKYLFTAEYSDGTEHVQTQEDVSATREGGSAFSDVDHGRLSRFHLDGPDGRYSVDLATGEISHDGIPVAVEGEPFAAATPLRVHYFRTHTHSRVTPASHYSPKGARTLEDGRLVVTDSQGEEVVYPAGAEIAQETEEGRTVYRVWPVPDSHSVSYLLGYEAEDAGGTTRRRYATLT